MNSGFISVIPEDFIGNLVLNHIPDRSFGDDKLFYVILF